MEPIAKQNIDMPIKLPCGKTLDEFIFEKGLNFNLGTALTYKWRAANKVGEDAKSDLAIAEYYIRLETKWQGLCYLDGREDEKFIRITRNVIDNLLEEAKHWNVATKSYC